VLRLSGGLRRRIDQRHAGELLQLAEGQARRHVVLLAQVDVHQPALVGQLDDLAVGAAEQQFAGLTGVAAVSLKGVSAKTPLIEREEGEPPTLRAEPSATQDMMQAAREVLNKAEEVITANQEALHQAVNDIATFSASLARNSDSIDAIVSDAKDTMSNAKAATASARTLMDNLDKRTEEITAGVNRLTSTATKQVDLAGRAITDLAHNPQRFLFGGGGSASEATPAPAPAPAAGPARKKPTAQR